MQLRIITDKSDKLYGKEYRADSGGGREKNSDVAINRVTSTNLRIEEGKREWKIEQIKQQLSNKLTNDQKGAE